MVPWLGRRRLGEIRDAEDIVYVMKDGVLNDGSTIDEVWPRAKPYGDYPWLLEGIYETDDRPTAGR